MASIAIAIVLTSCGQSLTDAQRVWCHDNDHYVNSVASMLGGGPTHPNYVANAAQKLGLEVPIEIIQWDTGAMTVDLGGEGVDVPNHDQVLDDWRTSSDYARACVAAYENR